MRPFPKILTILPLLAVAACGQKDRCEAPPQPSLLSVQNLTHDQKADALGVPPGQVPPDAVSSPAFDDYVARHNDALQVGYCVDNEAYKARNMKDEMSTIAHAVMATCKENNEPDTLATVLKYRNCATGTK
jgi:predicted small lipoprotein YifL